MRKTLGLLCAAAMMLPLGVITAGPAGAAGGTTCKTNHGTATFNPPLPPVSSTKTVNTTVTSTGTLSGCSGGGVTSAKYKVTYKVANDNCKKLLTYTGKTTTAPITTTWQPGNKGSTGTITLIPIKGKPTMANVTGVTKTGLFKGLHLTTQFSFKAARSTDCGSTSLAKVSVTGTKPVVIK
jgi:hypothetical protein